MLREAITLLKMSLVFICKLCTTILRTLKIVEKYNLKSDVHYLASHIFIKIIQVHNMNSDRFKQQLELAVREGNPEKFGISLGHIETLAKYCIGVTECM